MMARIMKKGKEIITKLITDRLKVDGRVLFAYLYGSFLTGAEFRDIDIFVFLEDPNNPHMQSVSIRETLSDAFREGGIGEVPPDFFDLRVMNDAPYDFVIDVLCDGLLIVDRDREARTDLIEEVSNQYRVNCALLDEVYR